MSGLANTQSINRRFESLHGWLNWLESCHPSSDIKLGLDRIGEVASRLSIGPTFANKKIVTVAGTNGKGSCVAALNALLHSAGYRVAYYTSPHFLSYNERIVINDQLVTDQALIAAFERVDAARQEIELTYFEFGTLAALDIFLRSDVDVVILEVGLGGRLDAVNIIEPDVAIVTSVDIDHEQWLGSDRESIGREKAGIFRATKPAVCADENPPASIKRTATQLGALLFQRNQAFSMTGTAQSSYCWVGTDSNGDQLKLTFPQLMLPSASVAAAIQALQLLNLPLTRVDYACLENLELAGRFQRIEVKVSDGQGALIWDVAHNPAAACFLAEKLRASANSGRTFALVGMLEDKDCSAVIDALTTAIDVWLVADLEGVPRAMAASDLMAIIKAKGIDEVSTFNHVQQAYSYVCSQMVAQDRVIVFGSFITVSELMKIVVDRNISGDSNE